MSYLEWSRACTARVRESHVQSLAARAQELSLRLAKEVDAGLLPFLRMGYVETLKRDMPRLVEKTRQYKHMLVLGIGGSALGTRAMQKAFAREVDMPGHGGHEGKQIWIADNVCPTTLGDWFGLLDPQRTVVVTISKSGGTIETISQYFLAREWLQKALGEAWKDHMIVVTDEAKGFLREEARAHGLDALEVPDNLGGRYSALSAVGLLPAAFLGIDWEALLEGAASLARPLVDNPASLATHPSMALASWAKALEDYGYTDLIFFCYEPLFAMYGPWFAQLWAESLGKEGLGTMPIPATGVTDQHSVNQMFLDGIRNKACLFVTSEKHNAGPTFPDNLPKGWEFLSGKPFSCLIEAESLGTRMALSMHDVPLVQICLDDASEKSGGKLMMLLEIATVLTGWLMGINPLDQPAVELGKRLANARLGKPGYEDEEKLLAHYLKTAEVRQDF
ncbi:MAG: glucose-6-phosphate isomerase [Candidatus Desulfovibrio faecigallinarum]|nr:glucose-6-phosphate isomerase [Candidatus Desulfovibrio faecigallinarum]